jgi:signal transduction histidine kinase
MVRNRTRRLNIRVETKYDADPTISCVPTQISQVFLNLFINATQAIEATQRTDGNWMKIFIKRLREEMLIQVADNGCGIKPGDLPHIFDPFFTTKDVGEGTGLGLSISHNIITGHGGRIEVNSTVGQGTIFRILLPLNPN